MPVMAEPEVKVTMALIRLTHGYHQPECTVTYDRLQAMTGLSRGGVSSGVAATNARGFIVKIGRSKWRSTVYQIDQNSLPDRPNEETNSLPDRPKQSTSQTKNSLPSRLNEGDTLYKKNKGKEKLKQTPHTPHPVFAIPDPLKGQDFEDAWVDWYRHRLEIDPQRPLTQTAGDKTLERLANWGKTRAIIAINHSIASSWKSIHEPKLDDPPGGNSNGRSVPTDTDALKARVAAQLAKENTHAHLAQ